MFLILRSISRYAPRGFVTVFGAGVTSSCASAHSASAVFGGTATVVGGVTGGAVVSVAGALPVLGVSTSDEDDGVTEGDVGAAEVGAGLALRSFDASEDP